MFIKEIDGDEVSAAGCFCFGKTTLAKLLVNDPQVQDVFVFGVKFQGPEDGKNKFDIRRYTLLVTTRMRFRKYDEFRFDCLSDEDAFHCSAMPSSTIDENIVNEMVQCCKRHPLTLSVVGGSLNGRDETVWLSLIKSLAKGESMLDLNQEILYGLERSFEVLEDKFKQAFLDFGMFLEDERIPAVVLLDMWVQIYKHDDEAVDTLATIHELSDINLVSLVRRRRKGRYATFNIHCAHKIVSQHDLLR